jgi:aldehyde dehydrogenase (NAD+)
MVEALADTFSRVKVGNPYAPDTQMGPLASQRALDRMTGYIAEGTSGGAKLACGGRPAGLDRGWYVEPTLFGDVDNRSAIAREEIFGRCSASSGPATRTTPCGSPTTLSMG